jgi:hypothetical protein
MTSIGNVISLKKDIEQKSTKIPHWTTNMKLLNKKALLDSSLSWILLTWVNASKDCASWGAKFKAYNIPLQSEMNADRLRTLE